MQYSTFNWNYFFTRLYIGGVLKFAKSALELWSMRPIWVDMKALVSWRLVDVIWMLTGWWWKLKTSYFWRNFRSHESLAYPTFPWQCCFTTRRIGSRSLKIQPMLPSLQGKHNPDAFYWYSSDLSWFNFNVCLICPLSACALAGLRLCSRMTTRFPFRLMSAYSYLVYRICTFVCEFSLCWWTAEYLY